MGKSLRTSYSHTIYACYLGYITQAIVNNFAPLLFLTFAKDFGLSLTQITLLTTVNFLVQLGVDLLSAKLIDRIGCRRAVLIAHGLAAAGLVGLTVLPELFGNAYAGLLTAVTLYAMGGGVLEVLVGPIVEACPTEKKEAAMSLLHSFYCWGHVLVVAVSTAFFALAGVRAWRLLAVAWAVIPLGNLLYFTQVPLYPIGGGEAPAPIRTLLAKKRFWLLILLMACAGASEQAMSQWASAFAEAGLKVSKTVGDLAGPCAFAVCMGTARALYGKFSDRLPLKTGMFGSAILCAVCYLAAAFAPHPILGLLACGLCGFSVGIFWPGTLSAAAWTLPEGGTAMYALMALAGDLGCTGGPTLVGLLAGLPGGTLRTGLLAAIAFPVLLLLLLPALPKKTNPPRPPAA